MDSGEDQRQPHDTTTVGVKAAAALALGLGSFALGVLPTVTAPWWRPKAARRRSPDTRRRHGHAGDSAADSAAASLMVLFGGGVLLFTSLVHLMSEVREAAEALRRAGRLPDGVDDPADLACCAGLFVTCAADEAAHALLAWWSRRRAGGLAGGRAGGRAGARAPVPQTPTDDVPLDDWWSGPEDEEDERGTAEQRRRRRDEIVARGQSVAAHETAPHAEPDRGDGSLQGLFTVLALSLHEVFEGLVLGLERSQENVWDLFIAVASHKYVIAFCVGLELARSNTRRAVLYVYVSTFAAVTVVGIACGMAIDLIDDHNAATDGLQGPVPVFLQAFAAGTILYVVFFEILPKNGKSGCLRLLAFLSGFLAMLILHTYTHKHSHGHHHHHDHGHEDHIHNHF